MKIISSKMLKYYFALLKEDDDLRLNLILKSHKFVIDQTKKYFGEDFFAKPLSILDLGCGKYYPTAYLFALDGHKVTALDMNYIVTSPSVGNYWRSLKSNGFLETARFIQLDVMGKRQQLQKRMMAMYQGEHCKPPVNTISFVKGDGETINIFKSNSFDLVLSKDVFEHLKNPYSVAKNIKKTLKPYGVCVHNIHLFTSIAGSHNPQWSDFKSYPPWSHLRERSFLLPGYLNEWRASNFVKVFSQLFSTVYFKYYSLFNINTQRLLNKQVYKEIQKNYPDIELRELLKDELIVFAKK